MAKRKFGYEAAKAEGRKIGREDIEAEIEARKKKTIKELFANVTDRASRIEAIDKMIKQNEESK